MPTATATTTTTTTATKNESCDLMALNNRQKQQLPMRFCAALTFLLAANAAQLPHYSQNAPLRYYHYPTPRHQLTFPQHSQHQQRHQQPYQPNYISYAQTHQSYVQQQTRPQYHQQQQQQTYRTQSSQPATSYYHNSQHLPASVTQKFAAPALENVAFTSALTNQGYTYGGSSRGSNAASSVSSARALPASAAMALPSSLVEAVAAGNDIAPEGAIDTSDASVNLKLPLPVNIAPIKVEPLPLQEGASFNELANGVTSYGTVYPQRKRK
ncbi:PREDICTED: transcription factor btd isoform X1 [Rhagoletis zephyria]|uniref:transcription factor btd isoform X1 n=1 Tax=Rhagoletis zephyria TaxID=28612 RepID=UPI0008118A51|nr:PREDICTED: transcription factor btd isoform X1 [Rhagoletis zephyria]